MASTHSATMIIIIVLCVFIGLFIAAHFGVSAIVKKGGRRKRKGFRKLHKKR